MSERVRIAAAGELSEPGSRVIGEVGGQEVAVFNVDGELHALANYCIHQSGPLCEGPLGRDFGTDDDGWLWVYEGGERVIHCPWHNWRFDVTTGENIDDRTLSVPTYDVEVEGDDVFVLV